MVSESYSETYMQTIRAHIPQGRQLTVGHTSSGSIVSQKRHLVHMYKVLQCPSWYVNIVKYSVRHCLSSKEPDDSLNPLQKPTFGS